MTVAGTADRELRALTRSIEWVDGTAFFFVVIEDLSHRDLILRRIEGALPTRRASRLAVTRQTSNVLDEIRARSPFEGHEALFVVGLENTIRNAEDSSAPVIRNLNASRDLFRTVFTGPITFMVSPPVLLAIAAGAPDFFSTRSGVFEIEVESDGAFDEPRMHLSELVSTLEGADTSFAERTERTAMLLDSVRKLRASGAALGYLEAADRAVSLLARVRDWEAARQLALEAFEASDREVPEYALRFLLHLARFAIITQDHDQARLWIDRAAAAADAVGDQRALVEIFELMAVSRWNAGDLDAAEAAFRQVADLAERHLNHGQSAVAWRNLGLLYAERGDFRNASEMLRRAMASAERTRDEALEADISSSASGVLHRAGFSIEAEDQLRRSIAILERIGDPLRLAVSHGELGQIFLERGELERAEAAFDRALLEATQAASPPSHKLPYLFGLFRIAIDRGDVALALERLHAARVLVMDGLEHEETPEARQRLATAQRFIDEALSQLDVQIAEKN